MGFETDVPVTTTAEITCFITAIAVAAVIRTPY